MNRTPATFGIAGTSQCPVAITTARARQAPASVRTRKPEPILLTERTSVRVSIGAAAA